MTVAEAKQIIERMAAIGDVEYPTVAEYVEALKVIEENEG